MSTFEIKSMYHEQNGESEAQREIFQKNSENNLNDETQLVTITKNQIEQIYDQLGKINLCWPDEDHGKFENVVPRNYYENSDKERLLLLYAANFQKQFQSNYPNRKPLFLASKNECNVQKMVCTTIRPTTISYIEFLTWDGCASFVADHIRFEPFENPIILLQFNSFKPGYNDFC